MFENKPLDHSDEPELLQEVNEARAALIEQVHIINIIVSNQDSASSRRNVKIIVLYLCSLSQVADLDDEFAELLLTDFSDNFDAVPSIKVSNV